MAANFDTLAAVFRRRWSVSLSVLALGLVARERSASADPQVSTGLTLGGSITDLRSDEGAGLAMHMGARGDILFLRNRERDMAIGPYIEASTEGFESIAMGGGVEWLAPVMPSFPFVLSAGSYAERAPGYPWAPGVSTRLFLGPRSYNFHSIYGLAAGLFVDGRMSVAESDRGAVVIGAQIDFATIALPFILAVNAFR